MKMGVHKDEIAPALGRADAVFMLQPDNIPWDVAEIAGQMCSTGTLHWKR